MYHLFKKILLLIYVISVQIINMELYLVIHGSNSLVMKDHAQFIRGHMI